VSVIAGRGTGRLRRMSALRILALVALASLLATGCSTTQERWAEAAYENLSFSSLYNVVVTTVHTEGYPVVKRDPGAGTIESDWVYGLSNSVVRGPARRKVFAEIEPLDGVDGYRVRLRVSEEVIPKGGLLATNPRASEGWEEWDDNFDIAEYLMTKIETLLLGNRVSPDFERRWSLSGERDQGP
jgi:hypothetical protein